MTGEPEDTERGAEVALTWTRRGGSRGVAEAAAARGSGDGRLERLLALVAGGGEEAFAELYREVAAAVFGLVGRVCGTRRRRRR
jgi:hypothetical protein